MKLIVWLNMPTELPGEKTLGVDIARSFQSALLSLNPTKKRKLKDDRLDTNVGLISSSPEVIAEEGVIAEHWKNKRKPRKIRQRSKTRRRRRGQKNCWQSRSLQRVEKDLARSFRFPVDLILCRWFRVVN